MFCMKCGSKMPDNVAFCSQCGAEMHQPQVNENVQSQVNENVQSQVNENVQSQVNENVQPQVNVNTQPQVNVNTQPQVNVNTQPQVSENVQPQVNQNTQPQVNEYAQPKQHSKIPNVITEETRALLSEKGLNEQNDAYYRPFIGSYWCQIDGRFFVFDEGIMFVGYEKEVEVCNISIYYSDIKETIFMLGGRGTSKNTVFVTLKNGKTFQIYVDDARKYSKFINDMVSNATQRNFSEPEFYVIPIKQGQPIDDTKVRIATSIPVVLAFLSFFPIDGFYIFILYFCAAYLSFEFCTQDMFLLKKHGFDTDELKKCNFIAPLYLYKRSQIINQKSIDLIIWCVFMLLHFII